HDLPRLAVSALDDVLFHPRALHRMLPVGGQALDRRDRALAHGRHRQHAGAHRLSVEVNRASAALGHPAPELRAGQPDDVAEDPKERHLLRNRHVMLLAVDLELHGIFACKGRRSARQRLKISTFMRTGRSGLSLASRGTRAIALTTAMPPHWPKIVYFPSRSACATSVMKNCEPAVPGPALAMASRPGRSNLSPGAISSGKE